MNAKCCAILHSLAIRSATAAHGQRVNRRKAWLASSALVRCAGLAILGAAGAMAFGYAPGADALPTDGAVVAGAASITTGKTALTVNQSSQNAVINWQSFSIGQNEAVTFVQPSSNSVALNRVLGTDPSTILGVLTANGQVFLLNPNGVLFAKGAQVNVAGLVASTLGISNANFMAGNYQFSGSSTATVLNKGAINAGSGGYVALLGADVSNEGVITARLGTVALAAGSALTLDVAGDGLLNVTIDQGAVNALAKNGGLIKANGGQVVMTAQAAGQLLKTVVNNTGVIEAQSVESHNGVIKLVGDNGDVQVSGALDASGLASGQTGGTVVVTGNDVALVGHARVNVSGSVGGGSALIGGNYRGADPASVPHATNVTMGKDVVISADAITAGNGGTAVLWSTGLTQALGTITARGGGLSGNGGLVETSGEQVTTGANTLVNTLAPHGTTGNWLLDPVNYTIAIAGGDETPSSVAISLATSNRLITATNDITVSDPITWSTPQTLTLNAGNDIIVNAAITASTAGAGLVLIAGQDVTINGALTSSGIGNLIQLTSGNDVTVNAAVTASANGALVEFNAGHDVDLNGAITASGGGAIVFRADENGVPGPTGGTVNLGTFPVTSTSKTIYYSPPNGYASPTPYVGFTSFMWVFVAAENKVYDGATDATAEFYGDPTVGGSIDVGLVPGTIAFVDKNVGPAKPVTFSGFSINGSGSGVYALFAASGDTTAAITPAPLTITANSTSKIYGQAVAFAPTAFTALGLQGGDTIASVAESSLGTVATASVAGGPYAITASNASGGSYVASNYTTTYLPGVLTLNPAPLTVTADNLVKTYGQSVTFAPTAFLASGLLNGDTIAAVTETSLGAVPTASVAGGPYAITASNASGGSYVASNYTTTYLPGVLTLNPAPLTVTADNLAKTYGQAVTFAPTAFVASGLLNGDTIAAVAETSPGAAATAAVAGGPYAITASGAVGGSYVASNYTTTYLPGVLTLNPAPLLVTADNLAKTYGQAVTFAPTAFVASGLVNGDTIAAVSETSPGAAATAAVAGGPYAITASGAVGGSYVASNYATTYAAGVLTLTPAALTITADSATKTDGDAISFSPTAFTAAGLQNGDVIAGVTETSPGAAASASLAGSPYAITASDAVGGTYVASNYATTYIAGALVSLPVVTPPVVTPPVVTPPVVTPPVVTPPAGSSSSGSSSSGSSSSGSSSSGSSSSGSSSSGSSSSESSSSGASSSGSSSGGASSGGASSGGASSGGASSGGASSGEASSGAATSGVAAEGTEVDVIAASVLVVNSPGATSGIVALPAATPQGLSLAVIGQGVRMPSYASLQPVRPDRGPVAIPAATQPLLIAEHPRKPDRN
jgi:filamentous hemagglutinin family protein